MRRRWPRPALLLALLLGALIGQVPRADAAPLDEAVMCRDGTDVRALVEEGLRIYRSAGAAGSPERARRRYELALLCYQRAFQVSEDPGKIHHPLGLAYEKLGRVTEAAESFQRFLAEVPEAERSPNATQSVRDKLAALRKSLGEVHIAAPPGATVFVDERLVGQAPLAFPVLVAPGSHVVLVRSRQGEKRQHITTQAGEVQRVYLAEGDGSSASPQPAAQAPLGRPVGERSMPAGTRKTVRLGLLIAGVSVFATGYLLSVVAGALCDSFECGGRSYLLYVPLVGPFAQMGYYRGPEAYGAVMAFLFIDGLLQTGGATLAILGGVLRKTVPLYAIRPYASPEGGGLVVGGRF